MVSNAHSRHEWEEPGCFEVAPGVYRIPLPLPNDGLRAVNVYAIAAGDELVLIDSGWALQAARTRLEQALASLGAGVGDVRRFLITHVHRDHYEQSIALRAEFGMPVALGEQEKPSMDDMLSPGYGPLHSQLTRLRRNGATELAAELEGHIAERMTGEQSPDLSWTPPDEWLADRCGVQAGQHALQVIATPGHTRGHVVFRSERLLFAGDHVLPQITPSLGFQPAPEDNPLASFLDSLALVRSMPDTRLLPAHGPVTESAHARVDELLEHHRSRLDDTFDAVCRGAETAADAAGLLTWTRREKTLPELDPYNRMLAVLETATHLDLLVRQGRLAAGEVDGVLGYRSA
jgi:glyoxylase-like metal-dependent hydrolase (beta-lactamase superfamily II)